MKFSKIYIVAFLAIGLTSCLDDKEIEDQKYGMINLDANKIVEIPSTSRALSLDNKDEDVTVTLVPIHLAADQVAQEDITVTLSVDQTQAMIDKYNADNGTDLVALTPDKFSLTNGYKVLIPKGSREAQLDVMVNSSNLDPASTYAIGFNIVNVDKPGYTISGNFNSLLTRISVKNIYHGTYTATGTFFHPTAGERAIDQDKPVTTVNATTSRVELGDLGGANYYMYLKVNPDNSVDILPDPTAVAGALGVYETGENSYDPSTNTFTLNYAYNPAAPRVVEETLVLK